MLRQVWLYGRILIGIALGVGVAYIIVREVQWAELLQQLSEFNWFLMIPVMGSSLPVTPFALSDGECSSMVERRQQHCSSS